LWQGTILLELEHLTQGTLMPPPPATEKTGFLVCRIFHSRSCIGIHDVAGVEDRPYVWPITCLSGVHYLLPLPRPILSKPTKVHYAAGPWKLGPTQVPPPPPPLSNQTQPTYRACGSKGMPRSCHFSRLFITVNHVETRKAFVIDGHCTGVAHPSACVCVWGGGGADGLMFSGLVLTMHSTSVLTMHSFCLGANHAFCPQTMDSIIPTMGSAVSHHARH
jgi:hypothetical protein